MKKLLTSIVSILTVAMVIITIGTAALIAADSQQACQQFDDQVERLDVSGAASTLKAAFSTAPSDYEVLYRMARLHVLLGNDEPNKDKQLALYEKAVDFGNKAIAANGKGMGGYVYRAAANGKIALFKGIFSVSDVVAKVRDDAWYAIKLGNGAPNMMAAAHYILGRAHLSLAAKPKLFRSPLGLGWGNVDEAYTHLKKARELRPGFVMYELEYAKCLAEMDKEQDALTVARKISGLKNIEPGDAQRKNEAKDLIADLE